MYASVGTQAKTRHCTYQNIDNFFLHVVQDCPLFCVQKNEVVIEKENLGHLMFNPARLGNFSIFLGDTNPGCLSRGIREWRMHWLPTFFSCHSCMILNLHVPQSFLQSIPLAFYTMERDSSKTLAFATSVPSVIIVNFHIFPVFIFCAVIHILMNIE